MGVPAPPGPPAPAQGYAKAIVTGMAGAVVTLVVTLWNLFLPKYPLPGEAVGALQTLVMGLATLLTPHDLFGGGT